MANELTPAGKKIKDITSTWWMGSKEPLMFEIYLRHNLVRNDEGTDTLRVGQGRVEYNEAYIMGLSDAELNRLLKINGMRIMLKHPYARRKPNPVQSYLASDITLGEFLGLKELPNPRDVFKGMMASDATPSMREFKKIFEDEIAGTSLTDEEIKSTYGKSMEELTNLYMQIPSLTEKEISQRHMEWYYGKLPEIPSENMQALMDKSSGMDESDEKSESSSGSEGNGEGESDGNGDDSHESDGNSSNGGKQGSGKQKQRESLAKQAGLWDSDPIKEQEINNAIRESMTDQKRWGSVPAGLRDAIIATLTPKADYRKMMDMFKKDIVSTDYTVTRSRPSRRHPLSMGRKYQFTCNLLWFGDTSASISKKSLESQLAFCVNFFSFGVKSIKAFCFDTKVYPIETITKPKFKLNIKGRGGTCIVEVLRTIINEPDFGGAIITTDGYFSDPMDSLTPAERAKYNQLKHKVLFVYENEECYQAHKDGFQGKIGRTSFIVPK